MKIGIIGAGNIGGTLARRLAALEHEVSVANSRGPETLADLAADTGARPVAITEIQHDAQVVIIAIPEKNVPDLPTGILDDLPAGAVVIDTGNYAPRQRDGRIEQIEHGVTESRWVEAQLGRPVIKAFNTIRPPSLATLGKPKGTRGRIALPVAGEDAAGKAVVIDLIDQLGFDGTDGGSLDDSWRQQPGTPVYCADLDLEGARKALAAATPERPSEWQA